MMEKTVIILDDIEASKLKTVAGMLKVMAHPLRLAIMHLLEQNSHLSVNEICEMLDAEQSLISHHLFQMRKVDLLEVEKDGRNKYYSLKSMRLSKIIECMDSCNYGI